MEIEFELWSLEDFGDPELALRIVSDMQSLPIQLRPSNFGVWEPTKPTGDFSTEEVLKNWLNREGNPNMGQLKLKSNGASIASWLMMWERNAQRPLFNSLSVRVDPEFVRSAEGCRQLLAMADTLCMATSAVFARLRLALPEKTNAYSMVNLRVRLPEPCWVQYFGAPYIELFGRDRLLSTPCHDVREIGAEHIKLALGDSPFDGIEREAAEAVHKHLGVDAFVERGRSVRIYKTGLHPEFDFSKVSNEVTIN